MLRISRLTDYAVVLATELARRTEPASVTELSEATEVPAPTTAKVLKALGRHGVVTSVRGSKGGYLLSAPPARISVVAVIEAIEGPVAVTECAEGTAGCAHEHNCGVRANWQRINRAVFNALDGISLEEMTRPVAPGELVPLMRSAHDAAARREQRRTS